MLPKNFFKTKITPLGHATVLMQFGEFTLITDPVLGDKIGMPFGPFVMGSRRLHPPPLRGHELPPIHAVLLSHAHYDHADVPTLRQIPKNASVIFHRYNGDLVKHFATRHELRWGQSAWLHHQDTPFLQVTSVRTKHWGARTLFDPWRGWGGFLLEIPSIPSPVFPNQPLSILFAGDTARTDSFAELRHQRQGRGVDLAIMPIGAYDPWIFNHCSPEQAWEMAMHDLGAHWFMPMHYGVFALSREPIDEPMRRLRAVAQQQNMSSHILGDIIGCSFSLPSRFTHQNTNTTAAMP